MEKGPKFASTLNQIPYKTIVAEVEASITDFPETTKHSIRTTTASILHRAMLPQHKNVTKEEIRAFRSLKKDDPRVIMKADNGNCFVIMDRTEYNDNMEALLSDRET